MGVKEYSYTIEAQAENIRCITEFTKAFEDLIQEIKGVKFIISQYYAGKKVHCSCIPYHHCALTVFDVLTHKGQIIDRIELASEISFDKVSQLNKRSYSFIIRKFQTRSNSIEFYSERVFEDYHNLLNLLSTYRLNFYMQISENRFFRNTSS